MEQRRIPEDTVERREESARHVLHAYRERRRLRRADDTYFGKQEGLFDHASAELGERELERRRSEILEDAKEAGMSHELAELMYDVALEEGVDPSLACELVMTGLGVSPPPDGVSNATSEPTVDKYLPPWMFPPEPTDHLLRERMLHVSFRRLRGLLEQHRDIDEALRAFANEPDVGHHGY